MSEAPKGIHTWFDVMGASIMDVSPLTKEELGINYDQLAAYGHSMTEFLTWDEFIDNALIRESDLLAEELSRLERPKDILDFKDYL